MSEAETEQKIVAAGLNAPRLSPAAHHAQWAGAALNTHSGFSITGSPSASVSPENDSQVIGENVAYENARREMWPLLGYALKDRLHRGINQ